MTFLLLLPVSGHLSRGFTEPPTKRAYSALHPQALTECGPLNFRRSSIETWRAKTTTCTYLEKAATLKKIKYNLKLPVNNMAYSRISFNHIQQKTNLLTTAVIRKRRRWIANMAVVCFVSSGEHFCLLFSTLLFPSHSGTF